MSTTSKKTYWLGLAFVILGIASLALFALLGSTIDEQGIVREPFALVPIGWLFILIGLMIAVVKLILSFIQKFRTKL